MTATTLLAVLREKGVTLLPAADKLRYGAAGGILTPDLRQQLAAHKQEILDLLRAEPPGAQQVKVAPITRLQGWAAVKEVTLQPSQTSYFDAPEWKATYHLVDTQAKFSQFLEQ